MDVNKIIDFVDVWAKTIGLTSSKAINTVKNDIIKRCDMYKKIKPFVTVDEDKCLSYIIKPKNGKYALEDFFLNRLMLGLREIEFDDRGKSDSNAMYTGTDKSMELGFEDYKLRIADKSTRHPLLVGKTSQILTKTFEHELGHCFKSSFTNGIKEPFGSTQRGQTEIYERLIQNLIQYKGGKYSNEIKPLSDMLTGEYSDLIKTGFNDSGYTWIDEMMTESEALRLTDSLQVQEILPLVDQNNKASITGNVINVYNYLSGYSGITGYGEIFRSIIGKKNCFNAEYISSKEILQKFDKSYLDVAQEVYGIDSDTVSAINCFYNDFDKLVKSGRYDEDVVLRLDEFFAKCYQKKVNKALEKGLPQERIDMILKDIDFFKSRMTTNYNQQKRDSLKHIVAFSEIESKLKLLNHIEEKKEEKIEIFDVGLPVTKSKQQTELKEENYEQIRALYEETSQPVHTKPTKEEYEKIIRIYEGKDTVDEKQYPLPVRKGEVLSPTVSNWQVEEQKRKEDQERYRRFQKEKRKREEEQRKKLDELKKQREQQQLAELRAIYEDDSYNPTWYIDNENKNTNGQRHGMRH